MTDKLSKVLIVDDEPIGRQLLEAILYQENFDLYFAEDGNKAYEKALQVMPDLILMDVMMPGMDGFEVCRKLREHEVLVNVPILLITALDDRDSMIKGLDAGADDYISKPFDRIEVLAKIKNITQFDRYKRILHEKNRADIKEEVHANKELSLYYSGLIQKSLLPSNEFISKLLNKYFLIIRSAEPASSNMFWISENKNKIITVLCNRKQHEISDILMNILVVTNLNKIIYKKDNLDPAEIIKELRTDIQYSDLNPVRDISVIDNFSIAVCILDIKNLQLKYAGLNIPLFYIKNNKALRAETPVIGESVQEMKDFKSVDIELSRDDSIYILSDNLLRYVEQNIDVADYCDLHALLQEKQNSSMKEQESFFNEYIEKATAANKDLRDIVFFGVKI